MARTVGSSAPQTRQRILDAAAEVFAEHGYSGASMRDIAERLGITKAALYYHFASKEDLLDGLVQPAVQALTDYAQAAESGLHSPAEMLHRFLDLTIEGIPGLHPLMVDPGARAAVKTRHHPMELIQRIETHLSGGTDPDQLLRWQFALGGIRTLVMTRLFTAMRAANSAGPDSALADGCLTARHLPDDTTLFSDAEREVVIDAALAGLGSGS
ncbi:TetR family transcriptional regulator [Streptacidiphilus sp. PAMC 29251]